MTRALVDATVARLEAEVPSRTVYANVVPADPSFPYLVVRSNVGVLEVDTLSDTARLRDCTLWITSVSDQPAEATWGAERAQAALLPWRPTVGEIAWKPTHRASLPVSRDDELPAPVFFAVDTYGVLFQ